MVFVVWMMVFTTLEEVEGNGKWLVRMDWIVVGMRIATAGQERIAEVFQIGLSYREGGMVSVSSSTILCCTASLTWLQVEVEVDVRLCWT